MKLAVFGATGGVGRQLVTQGLDRGHSVTAFVRDARRLPVEHPALTIVTVPSLTDAALLVPALRGSDAVLSAVGPRSRRDGPVTSRSIETIVQAMDSVGVKRIIALSAVPVGPVPPDENVVNRWLVLPLLRTLLRDNYADLALKESQLSASSTDWTVFRPPRLYDRALTANYRITLGGNVGGGSKVSRANVAHAMLAALDQPTTVRMVVGVSQ